MKNFEEFKKIAAEKASEFADKALIFAKKAADETKDLAAIAKLKAEIAGEKEKIKENYSELGKLCYELYKDDPSESMAQAISEITVSNEIIAAKEAEIADLKKNDDISDDDIPETEEAPADEKTEE